MDTNVEVIRLREIFKEIKTFLESDYSQIKVIDISNIVNFDILFSVLAGLQDKYNYSFDSYIKRVGNRVYLVLEK